MDPSRAPEYVCAWKDDKTQAHLLATDSLRLANFPHKSHVCCHKEAGPIVANSPPLHGGVDCRCHKSGASQSLYGYDPRCRSCRLKDGLTCAQRSPYELGGVAQKYKAGLYNESFAEPCVAANGEKLDKRTETRIFTPPCLAPEPACIADGDPGCTTSGRRPTAAARGL